jgi:hypothetical protein
VRLGAWSRVLEAASDLMARDAASPASSRAVDGCRRQMRLGEEGIATLVKLRAGQSRSY